MSFTTLQQLMQQAESAEKSISLQERIEKLTAAFTLFSEQSSRLELAYEKLQEQFKAVNRELESANHKLQEKVGELDLITHYVGSILKNMSQGVLFIGEDAKVTTYNPAAEKILGKKQESVLYQSFHQNFSDDFLGFSLSMLLKGQITLPLLVTTLDHRVVEVATSRVAKGAKESRGVIILLQDVTEIKRLEQSCILHERMRELGEMAASMAHEIRNPLGGIEGYASLLFRDLEMDPEKQKMALHIIEGVKTLGRLVHQVLDYARPSPLNVSLVNLSELLQELTDFLRLDSSCKASLCYLAPKKAILALVDRELIWSALLNICLNGLQAMPQGGRLTLHIQEDNALVRISISDTGEGIDPSLHKDLFSPFFTTKKQGCGLGLWQVQKVARAHLGSITVHSEPNQGATFTLILPHKGASL